MGKKYRKSKGQTDTQEFKRRRENYEQNTEPCRAFVRVHPSGTAIAISVGTEIRIYSKIDDTVHTLLSHTQSQDSRNPIGVVRDICFSRCGSYFACGGDDKLGRLWSCQSWQLLSTVKSQKKVSAINFSGDGRFVFFGNKFGDVLVAPTTPQTTQETRNTATGASSADSAPAEIFLGHYCSILTSLSISHHGKYIATTDRDAKTRVSIMPDDPLNGALDIQTFCFGHSMFVTCSAFINYHSASCGGNEKELLLTGSGDGTLRLWDFMTGRLLCTLLIGLTVEQDRLLREQQGGQLQLEPDPQEQQQQQQQDDDDNDGDGDDDGHGADTTTNGEAKEGTAAIKPTPVLTIQPTPDGAHVLVTLDGDPAVRLVSINFEEETMTLHEQMLSLPSLPIISDMCLDPSSNLFWMIGGPVASNESNDVVLACVSLETAASRLNVVEYSNSPIPSLGREEISNAMGMLCHGESKDGTAVVPRKYIPSYLNKRMFNSRRFEGKKSEKEA